MTASAPTAQGNDADRPLLHAVKNTSPEKDKGTPTPAADGHAKPSKKRRKVNQGKALLRCAPQYCHWPLLT